MFNFSGIFNHLYLVKDKITETLGEIFVEWQVRIYLGVAILLNMAAWGLMFFIRTQAEQTQIILHYNVDFGADLIGKAPQLTIIPVLGLVAIGANLLLTLFFVHSDNFKFLSHLLLFTAVAVNLFLLISLGPIYLINFQ